MHLGNYSYCTLFKKSFLLSLLVFVRCTLPAEQPHASVQNVLDAVKAPSHGHATFIGKETGRFFKDVFMLQTKLVNWDTLKVIVGTFPFFIAGRMIDDRVHSCFYEREHHKNKHQMHNGCYKFAEKSLAIPIVILGSGVFWAKDPNFRETSRVFLIGMPFVIWSKELIKKWKAECCKRPWNEKFSCHKQAYGGFPSGHMAEIVYSTVLFGMRLGPKVGVPLGIISLFVGVNFVSANRHYVSQIIAGAGLGVVYALAADKLISANLESRHPVNVQLAFDEHGAPGVQVGIAF